MQMLMVHPSTPHDAPPQRRTPSEVRNNTDTIVSGGPPSYQMGPTENEKRKKKGNDTEFRPGKRPRHTRQVSYKTLISRLFFGFFLGDDVHLGYIGPSQHLTCLGILAGKHRQIQFVCASSSSSPVHPKPPLLTLDGNRVWQRFSALACR